MDFGSRSSSETFEMRESDNESLNLTSLFDEDKNLRDATRDTHSKTPPQSRCESPESCEEENSDLEKYKNLAYMYFSKYEELEDKYKKLEDSLKCSQTTLEKTEKQRDDALKEKENMVIKYAFGEKKILSETKLKEIAEKKCKQLTREGELLQHKLQTMISEKSRICQILDKKVNEQRSLQQENDKLKADITFMEGELKRCQNNMKNEIHLHRESQKTIENLNKKIIEAAEEVEQSKRGAQESIKAFKYSEENEAHILDQKCKEQQASLILIKHERDDREKQVKTLQTTLDRSQSKQIEMLHENNDLSQKVQQLERKLLESRQQLSELRGCADQQLQNAADLQMKTKQLEQYKLQLTNEQEQLKVCKEQMCILKSRNSDLKNDIEACRKREAELLLFTQQLTDKNVRLQSEFTALETKVQHLTSERTTAKRNSKEHETKATLLLTQLTEQEQKYREEVEELKNNWNDQIKLNAQLKQELFDQKGENTILKRKHELSLKEMQKELQQCRRNLEMNNSKEGSNSSSTSSLSGCGKEKGNGSYNEDNVKVIQPDAEIDRQTLIEHIVKLQRLSARKSEKIDFLEEHVNTLIAELQKKSKILQIYMLREQTGTLTSDKMDSTKANLAKLNGVMASMYSSRVADEHLTLELSLDINRKLQAVLEDALLKNITLKKNVDTLGQEIDRLNSLLKC